MSTPLLAADRVTVALGGRVVLEGATLALRAGERLAIVGPNGAGKTTLIRAFAGLERPKEGAVTLDGVPLAGVAPRARARRIGYLPQGHVFHWPLPVADVVALGRLPHGAGSAADRDAVAAALAATDLEAFADRPVTTLSGGERARVAIARVLAGAPAVILADEPIAALDLRYQLVVLDLLARHAAAGGAVAVVLHDLGLAARFADRIVVLDRGRIVEDGPAEAVLTPERLAATFGVSAAVERRNGRLVVIADQPA
ncbi:ABC transporter ATP-binding protein [Prosthecomicrobium pneumaticum]|uniref:Iron complex transport system ATP-binding protein n=1 Tax=Prosthecomicrobium pneumaticum TaxID=81895 RepID=A0A7W9FPS4_9HYPH|nr:ABC transporter ATP-binding protein [Prosthecomicrobium pneumaticum]MBB5754562.1 iron complex transport system ATP-binding protein [Prosthecomicrobium pneumaticum]